MYLNHQCAGCLAGVQLVHFYLVVVCRYYEGPRIVPVLLSGEGRVFSSLHPVAGQ